MKIVGIIGVKQAGKDTTADKLISYLSNSNIKRVALADKLKKVCSRVFEVPLYFFNNQELKEVPLVELGFPRKYLTPCNVKEICDQFNKSDEYSKLDLSILHDRELISCRDIAQIVGTDLLRSLGDDDIHCKNLSLGEDITIITDIRFPNEFRYFNNLDGYEFIPVYINRDQVEGLVDPRTSHSSEIYVKKMRNWSDVIDNNGTLDDLEIEVGKFLMRHDYLESK